MRRITHKIKIVFIKIRWIWQVWFWAMTHHKQVKNYKYLMEAKKTAKLELLKTQKEENSIAKDRVNKLEIQIALLDNIINYVGK